MPSTVHYVHPSRHSPFQAGVRTNKWINEQNVISNSRSITITITRKSYKYYYLYVPKMPLVILHWKISCCLILVVGKPFHPWPYSCSNVHSTKSHGHETTNHGKAKDCFVVYIYERRDSAVKFYEYDFTYQSALFHSSKTFNRLRTLYHHHLPQP